MENKDLTFVVQGAIDRINTSICLNSIRKNFPGSMIVLSTWEGSDVSNLNYDIVILNKDVITAPIDNSKYSKTNNINRQIYSTINGLKKVRTKFAFKIRTDFVINGSTFYDYFEKFNKFNKNFKIFNHRVMACSFGTRNPEGLAPYPFHIGDFAFFGYTEDLINLFDIPLATEEELYWFKNHKKPENFKNKNIFFCKFVAEQHIMIKWLEKNSKAINCKHFIDNTKENIEFSKQYIVNNFILLNFNQFNLKPLKKELGFNMCCKNYLTIYSHYDYLLLYKKYCDNSIVIPNENYELKEIKKAIKKLKFKKFFINILLWLIPYKPWKMKIRLLLY